MCKKLNVLFSNLLKFVLLVSIVIGNGCKENPANLEILVDELGATRLFVLNSSKQDFVAQVERKTMWEDSTRSVFVKSGSKVFLFQWWGIGGGLRPADTITALKCISIDGQKEIYSQNPILDSLWRIEPGTNWKETDFIFILNDSFSWENF